MIYLRVEGQAITGFSSIQDSEYTIEADITPEELAPKSEYCYKYIDGELMALSENEKSQHPVVRNNKLHTLRSLRDSLFEDADNEIKKHYDGDNKAKKTESEYKAYRIALRNITDDYKDENGNGNSSLDAYNLDMSNFNLMPSTSV